MTQLQLRLQTPTICHGERVDHGSSSGPGPTDWSLLRLTLLGRLKRLMLWLLVVYVSVPFIVKLCPSIQAKLVFLNFGEFTGRKARKSFRTENSSSAFKGFGFKRTHLACFQLLFSFIFDASVLNRSSTVFVRNVGSDVSGQTVIDSCCNRR